MTGQPYLSMVMVGRNDNYGEDFNYRLQNCLTWTIKNTEKYGIPSEIIFVNYNPITDQPSLQQVLKFPNDLKHTRVRLITVPKNIHKEFCDPAVRRKVPLFEYIAKNIGIRRATGEFILSANPDILIHPRIFEAISKQQLKKQTYYRSDRCDFSKFNLDFSLTDDQIFAQLNEHTFKFVVKGKNHIRKDQNETLGSVRFRTRIRNFKNRNMIRIEKIANYFSWPVIYDYLSLKYHTNCGGDFMLMHRSHWYDLNGHPENTYLAIHTDALFVIMAAMSGYKEVCFSDPIYHQDHERRYRHDGDIEDPDIREMFNYMNREGSKMEKTHSPIIYNDENWGCSKLKLEETVIACL